MSSLRFYGLFSLVLAIIFVAVSTVINLAALKNFDLSGLEKIETTKLIRADSLSLSQGANYYQLRLKSMR